ncbi:hypothetical protein [Crenobacter caeni]|uniref:Uncharacterized protein n=1 Tax=Crenobacter caeni TaxID=2705474 RepID=A0A6B2KRB6_9NEIS|nr:hypothetical protein [Crenobacter caeni]NDV12772.1 hypothetical protein [Crenobacter caeni]
MSLPISSLDKGRGSARYRADQAVSPRPAAGIGPLDTEAAKAPLAAPRNREPATWRYSAQLNDQLTSAQRSLDYLDDLYLRMQAMKGELGRQLSEREIDPSDMEAMAERVREAWRERGAKSGGSLDNQLHLRLNGDARQPFTVRGFELASLREGKAETLLFYADGAGKPPAQVAVGDNRPLDTLLRDLNRALMPSGVQAALDDAGELAFSVGEAAWPQLRERFAASGGGVRLPAGVPQRLRLDAQPGLLDGQPAPGSDHASVRQRLQFLVQAMEQVAQARASVKAAIAEARRSIEALSRMNEEVWARSFAGDFNARLNRPDGEQVLFEVIPALAGVSRHRVLSLLALR